MFFIRLFSRLPMPVLYFISDILSFLVHRVVGYRRKVVAENLRRAFPGNSPQEYRRLERRFYRNFTDLVVEVIKSLTLTEQQVRERVRVLNPELLQPYADRKQSVLIMASHQCNWEWLAAGVCTQLPYKVDGVYRPLSNRFFDRLMFETRSRFGGVPVPMREVFGRVEAHRKAGTFHALGLVADQVPPIGKMKFWTTFLGQDTAFFPGAQLLAEKSEYPVIYVEMVRVKRGYYTLEIFPVAEPPYQPGAWNVLERYAELCEHTVRRAPADWLWSHKRWKYGKEEDERRQAEQS